MSRWHLIITSFWRQLGSSLEFYLWHLRVTSFWCQLGSPLGMKIPGDSLSGIPLCFLWRLGINSFWRQLGYLLALPRWHLGINSVWCHIGSLLGFAIPGDSFSGIPPCIPCWFLLCLFVCVELRFSPLGVYYSSPLLGNYINHQRTRLPTFPSTQLLIMHIS